MSVGRFGEGCRYRGATEIEQEGWTDLCVTVAYGCSLDRCGVDSKSGSHERKKCDWRDF
jgi:hypothetical protein